MTSLAFIDTETTSLSATLGEIWEVAAIVRDIRSVAELSDDYRAVTQVEHRWLLPVTLTHADPISLAIGRFHERHPQGNSYGGDDTLTPIPEFVREVGALTHGAHLVGNVVSFDEERLRKLLVDFGVVPSWHYHLVDVEALAAGRLGLAPPWDSRQLGEALGVEPPTDDERHTALGDAHWAMRTYDAVMARAVAS